jgi:hypothetical protein
MAALLGVVTSKVAHLRIRQQVVHKPASLPSWWKAVHPQLEHYTFHVRVCWCVWMCGCVCVCVWVCVVCVCFFVTSDKNDSNTSPSSHTHSHSQLPHSLSHMTTLGESPSRDVMRAKTPTRLHTDERAKPKGSAGRHSGGGRGRSSSGKGGVGDVDRMHQSVCDCVRRLRPLTTQWEGAVCAAIDPFRLVCI